MSSAVKPKSDRVRQIAILVSSVDAAAARQLLLHLPTDLAKQVRALASQLGTISPAEKRSILAAFQQSNAGGTASKPVTPSATPALKDSNPVAADAVLESKTNIGPTPASMLAARAIGVEPIEDSDSKAPAWTKLSTEALIRFVKGERVAIVAVVISQLAPRKAVEVLQQLPRDMNHQVIKRLSHLQDIDPDATAAIDEHLVERLSQYEFRMESEHENTRRLNALLAAAPRELQDEWRGLLSDDGIGIAINTAHTNAPKVIDKSTQATIAELYGDAVIMSDSMSSASQANAALQSTARPPAPATEFSAARASQQDSRAHEADELEEQADVIPFPGSTTDKQAAVDRSLLHAEFERILTLAPQDLAVLLSNIDSQSVLLAFAGATPDFMQRFTRLLRPADAKMFVQRLQKIGPMNLRDVDEAQSRILEKAAHLLEANEYKPRRAA